MTVGVGNSIVDAAHQTWQTANLLEDLATAGIPDSGNEVTNLFLQTASATIATIATGQAIGSAVQAATSTAGTMGFYLQASLTTSHETSSSTLLTSTAALNSITAGNGVNLNAGNT